MEQGIYWDRRTEQYIFSNCSAQPGELQVFYLFGKEYLLGREHYYVVRAAAEAENEAFRRGRIQFSYSARTELEERRKEYFPGLYVMGWAVNQPGYGIYDVQRYAAMHECFFEECPLFMLLDGREEECSVYLWENRWLERQRQYNLFEDPQPRMLEAGGKYYEKTRCS